MDCLGNKLRSLTSFFFLFIYLLLIKIGKKYFEMIIYYGTFFLKFVAKGDNYIEGKVLYPIFSVMFGWLLCVYLLIYHF